MTTDLLPCPFCGKVPPRAYMFGYQYGTHGVAGHELWSIDHVCAPGHGKSEADAIAAWNRRADLSPSPEVVKELVEALRITRDRLLSHLHNELDGVWSEQDFLDEVKEADAVLAKLEGGE